MSNCDQYQSNSVETKICMYWTIFFFGQDQSLPGVSAGCLATAPGQEIVIYMGYKSAN